MIKTALNEMMLGEAIAAVDSGQYEKAFEYIFAVLAVDPGWIKAHRLLLAVTIAFTEHHPDIKSFFSKKQKSAIGDHKSKWKLHNLKSFNDRSENLAALPLFDEQDKELLLSLSRAATSSDDTRVTADIARLVDKIAGVLARARQLQ